MTLLLHLILLGFEILVFVIYILCSDKSKLYIGKVFLAFPILYICLCASTWIVNLCTFPNHIKHVYAQESTTYDMKQFIPNLDKTSKETYWFWSSPNECNQIRHVFGALPNSDSIMTFKFDTKDVNWRFEETDGQNPTLEQTIIQYDHGTRFPKGTLFHTRKTKVYQIDTIITVRMSKEQYMKCISN